MNLHYKKEMTDGSEGHNYILSLMDRWVAPGCSDLIPSCISMPHIRTTYLFHISVQLSGATYRRKDRCNLSGRAPSGAICLPQRVSSLIPEQRSQVQVSVRATGPEKQMLIETDAKPV